MRRFFNLLLTIGLVGCACTESLVPYVDTMIGTGALEGKKGNRGQTLPAVLMPNGMTFWTPQTRDLETKGVSPYYYFDNTVQGFRSSHWIVGGCTQDYGSATIMPLAGTLVTDPEQRASELDRNTEVSTPYRYDVDLFGGDIAASMTGLSHSGIFAFTYRQAGKAYIVINPNSDESQGTVSVDPQSGEVCGENPVHRIYQGKGLEAGFSGHFILVPQKAPSAVGVYDAEARYPGETYITHKDAIGAWLEYDVRAGETLLFKLSNSFCDLEGARRNMAAEIPDWDFKSVEKTVRKAWEDCLGRIRISTDDPVLKQQFYTALYHCCFLPREFSDVDGRYPSFAGGTSIQVSDGVYYDDYSLWDTYRALHPLFTLLNPRMTGDMMQSLVDKAEQGGWMPIFPCWNSYTSEMIGDHAASVIADAYLKGVRNFDAGKAYRYLRQNAFELPATYGEYSDGKGRRALDDYMALGYIPYENEVREAYHKREQVSRTLEYAYDDYALALFARALGHEDDARELMRRSGNWRNVLDPSSGWVQARFRDGSFRDEDNAFSSKSFITEGKPCQYTWYVPHDPMGLMEAMGGREVYLAKLDSVFSTRNYNHGNEPSHQIAYMYDYAGEKHKTQAIVRDVLREEYKPGADGLSGNDDAGQMSAWYIFSSLGFYPVCPVSGEYMLAAPAVRRATIRMPGGKRFRIIAKGLSRTDVFWDEATLNGKPLTAPVLPWEAVRDGGRLVFRMTDGRSPSY